MRKNIGLIIGILIIGGVFFFSNAFASTTNLIVESCSVQSGTATINNCLGLNTSDSDTDLSIAKSGVVATTMSNIQITGTVNSVTATIRHGGATGIGNNLGITFWNSASGTTFCTEKNLANSESFVTETTVGCTTTGGWTQTKLNDLQLRIKNKDQGSSQNAYVAYAIVNIDYNGSVCGNNVIEGTEVCDGGTAACTVNGYAGTKPCNSTCNGYGTCTTTLFCGDGIKNSFLEACDGMDLNGHICSDFNSFTGGTLACKSNCTFDVNGCF